MKIIVNNNSTDAYSFLSNTVVIPANSSVDVSSVYWYPLYTDETFMINIRNGNLCLSDGLKTYKTPEENEAFLSNVNVNVNYNNKDIDGAQIVRVKAAKKGWTYGAIPFELSTAKFDSLWAHDLSGNLRADICVRFYNAAGEQITDASLESTIVRTVVDFEPTYDYEIIGGVLRLEEDILPPNNCRLWIVAVPDIPAVLGGSKEMTAGVNLRFLAPQNEFKVDGRVSKLLSYSSTYHTNKLRFILVHEPGMHASLSVTIELYRQ
jgi:hypothetical protein